MASRQNWKKGEGRRRWCRELDSFNERRSEREREPDLMVFRDVGFKDER